MTGIEIPLSAAIISLVIFAYLNGMMFVAVLLMAFESKYSLALYFVDDNSNYFGGQKR